MVFAAVPTVHSRPANSLLTALRTAR